MASDWQAGLSALDQTAVASQPAPAPLPRADIADYLDPGQLRSGAGQSASRKRKTVQLVGIELASGELSVKDMEWVQ
jgi:hypothetical protein